MHPTIAFLQRVLPDANFYAGMCSAPVSDQQRNFTTKVFTSIEDLGGWLLRQSMHGYDTHFGLSGFAQGWHDSPVGRRNVDGTIKQEFRTQRNAVAQKLFWLDVDVGEDKPYLTQLEAMGALKSFLDNAQLPLPTVVSSGYGLHVYWCLTDQLETAQWNQLSAMLDALTRTLDFRVDTPKTMDSSSSPRAPGTHNYKHPLTPKPVEVLIESIDYNPIAFCEALVAAIKRLGVTPTVRSTTQASPPESISGLDINTEAFAATMGWTLENKVIADRDPLLIIKGCRQIRESGTQTEPVWFKMMTVARYCIDGDTMVHALSKPDPRYDWNATADKFQYARDSGGGPALCASFDRDRCGVCTDCPYFGKISSPVELGRVMKEAEPIEVEAPTHRLDMTGAFSSLDVTPTKTITIQPIKSKFFENRPGEGLFYIEHEEVSKDAAPILHPRKMCEAELYPMCVHIYIDSSTKRQTRYYVWRKVVNGRAPEDILMNDEEVSTPRAQGKWLSNNALIPLYGMNKEMRNFMMTYLSQVQNSLPEIYVKDHFGWTDAKGPNGKLVEGFVHGSTMYIPGMAPQPVNLNPRCQRMAEKEYCQSGDLETWKRIPQMYRVLDQKEAQFAMCAGFAAPFMRFSNGTATNAVINLWESVGGVGKSTILHAVNSIWGHPIDALIQQEDTEVARYMVAGTRRNLPVCMDEMTMLEDRPLSSMLYTLANGKEKRKGASATELAETGEWSTIVLMTSNNSILDKMMKYSAQAQAQVMRAMDIHVDLAAPPEKWAYIEETIALLNNNYGLAGPVLMSKVMETPEILDRLPALLQSWNLSTSTNPAERFWVYGCAVILLIGNLAKSYGLIDFDMVALEKWTQELLNKLRNAVTGAKTDAASLLVDFLNDKHAATLTVLSAKRPPEMPDGSDTVTPDMWVKSSPRGNSLDIRYELDTKTLYVSTKSLRTWCKENNVNVDTMLSGLAKEGIWKPDGPYAGRRRVDLGAGVKILGRGQSQCYLFSGLEVDTKDGQQAPTK